MNYDQSIAYIESLITNPFKPGLERFSQFMHQAGNIQDNAISFHIAGTNGKGSTAAMLDSILLSQGLSPGRFTGPHLLRWNERFHVNGKAINDVDFARICTNVREQSEKFATNNPDHGPLSWFELLTAMAFTYFHERNTKTQVLEVGLGGRWDATNVLSAPSVCAIVSISLDHTHILGNTLQAIAQEKAGIIKSATPLVTAAREPALSVIRARAHELGSGLIVVGITKNEPTIEIEWAEGNNEELEEEIRTQFKVTRSILTNKGSYQELNGLVSIAMIAAAAQRPAAKRVTVSKSSIVSGLKSYFWPGRFQYFADQRILADGAHNAHGAEMLRIALDKAFPLDRRIYVLSFFQNKDVPQVLATLLRPGDLVFAGNAKSRRAVFSAQEIAQIAKSLGCDASAYSDIDEALEHSLAKKHSNDLVIVTGSFESVKSLYRHQHHTQVEDSLNNQYEPQPL